MTDEQRQRIHDIEYSCDSRAELAERIVALEDENAVLTIKHNAEHIIRQNVEADNAKLREELAQWERLTAGIELPEYPITQFQPKDLERENAKLWELVRRYVEYTSQDRCEGCVVKSRCNDGDVDECWQLTEIRGLARELGIEVDG